MNRRSFLRLLGSVSVLALPPVRMLLCSTADVQESTTTGIENRFTLQQLEMLQKIQDFETQLQQQQGRFSWYLHNELRHYWGAFSEAKSLAHADAILEHSVMDAYILNTLSDWYAAPQERVYEPALALQSLQRRAENYPALHYVRAACWLRAGEISDAIGNESLAQAYRQRVINLSERAKHRASQLQIYQRKAQEQLMA